MTTEIAREVAKLFNVPTGDVWDTKAPGLINKAMTEINEEGMNGEGALTNYEMWFRNEFIEEVVGYGKLLDLALPESGYAYLALEDDIELTSQVELRGWNSRAIEDFNNGFMRDVMPKLLQELNG